MEFKYSQNKNLGEMILKFNDSMDYENVYKFLDEVEVKKKVLGENISIQKKNEEKGGKRREIVVKCIYEKIDEKFVKKYLKEQVSDLKGVRINFFLEIA